MKNINFLLLLIILFLLNSNSLSYAGVVIPKKVEKETNSQNDGIPLWINQLNNNKIISGKSIAGVEINDFENEIYKLLNKPNSVMPVYANNVIIGKGLNYRYDSKELFISLKLIDNFYQVNLIKLCDSNYSSIGYLKSSNNVSIGNAISEMESELGKPIKVQSFSYCSDGKGKNFIYDGVTYSTCSNSNLIQCVTIK